MGVIKGFFVVILSVLLFLSLLSVGIFGTLNSSLKLENVKPHASNLILDMVGEENDLSAIDENSEEIEIYCQNNSDFIFNSEGETLVIPCETASKGSDAIIEYTLNSKIEEYYYKEYSCKFWKCFKQEQNPLFLISEHSKNFWKSKYYTSLLISILLVTGLFFLYSRKNNLPIIAGAILLVVSLIVSGLDSIGTAIIKAVMNPVSSASNALTKDSISNIVSVFFSSANSVFLTMFIISLILIAGGILLKVFKIGFKINKVVEKVSKKEDN